MASVVNRQLGLYALYGGTCWLPLQDTQYCPLLSFRSALFRPAQNQLLPSPIRVDESSVLLLASYPTGKEGRMLLPR